MNKNNIIPMGDVVNFDNMKDLRMVGGDLQGRGYWAQIEEVQASIGGLHVLHLGVIAPTFRKASSSRSCEEGAVQDRKRCGIANHIGTLCTPVTASQERNVLKSGYVGISLTFRHCFHAPQSTYLYTSPVAVSC